MKKIKITKRQRKAGERNQMVKDIIAASNTRKGMVIELSDRTYAGRNPEYVNQNAGTLMPEAFRKVRAGIPFVRVGVG